MYFGEKTSYEQAQKIMGNNFFGVIDAEKYLKANSSDFDVKSTEEVTFSEDELKHRKDTHIPMVPLNFSILDLRDRFTNFFSDNCFREGFEKEIFTQFPDRLSKSALWNWNDLEKEASSSGLWNLIEKNISGNYYQYSPANARVLAYTIIGNYLKTSERLYESNFQESSSRTGSHLGYENGSTVWVGFNKEGKLDFHYSRPESIRSEDGLFVLGYSNQYYRDDGS